MFVCDSSETGPDLSTNSLSWYKDLFFESVLSSFPFDGLLGIGLMDLMVSAKVLCCSTQHSLTVGLCKLKSSDCPDGLKEIEWELQGPDDV